MPISSTAMRTMRRARNSGILAGIEHAGEIIERRVRVGAAHRLVQRGDQVVVAVLRLVVDRRAALQHLLQRRGVEDLARAWPRARLPRPASARRGRRHRPCGPARRAPPRRAAAACPRPPRHGPRSRRIAASSSDRNTITRARDSSAALSSKDGFSVVAPTSVTVPSSITGRKLSCWARLKRWISSTNSSVPRPDHATRPRRLEHLLEIGDAREDRRDLLEGELGLAGQEARHRGLAGAGRPPEDQAAERAGGEQPRQRAVRPDEMVLPDHLGRACSASAGRRAGGARPCSSPAAAKRSLISAAEDRRDLLPVAVDRDAPDRARLAHQLGQRLGIGDLRGR